VKGARCNGWRSDRAHGLRARTLPADRGTRGTVSRAAAKGSATWCDAGAYTVRPDMTEVRRRQVTSDPQLPDFDTGVAHNARVWNYWLGGKDNYAADRAAGDTVQGLFPSIVDVARADRAFLGRVVQYLAGEAGVRQFLDIGTGLPTASNTHEVAQKIAPDARVVYVDNDPLVLAHARALLVGTPQGRTAYVDADAHRPEDILRAASDTLDFSRPVAVMLLGLLNFILDDADAKRVVSALVSAVPAGSYLVITHPTLEVGGQANADAMRFWNENATPPITARSSAQIARFFEGMQLLDPGIVPCSRWRPMARELGNDITVPQLAGVARKN
jgi:O-methyltransferase involved in polyketide biosynthesis